MGNYKRWNRPKIFGGLTCGDAKKCGGEIIRFYYMDGYLKNETNYMRTNCMCLKCGEIYRDVKIEEMAEYKWGDRVMFIEITDYVNSIRRDNYIDTE